MGEMSLVNVGAGIGIEGWTPAIQPIKGDGVFTSSPFLDGSQLKLRKRDDAVETYELVISGAKKPEIDLRIANLLLALEAAVNFWTGQIALPDPYAYLEYKSSDCTDYQYAIIKDYRFSLDDDITTIGKNGSSMAVHATLTVRRGAWQETRPGEYVDQEFGIDENVILEDGLHAPPFETFELRKSGGATNQYYKPLANFWTGADITDLYYFDASVPAYSANLMNSVPPYDVFPVPAAAGDYLYFAITDEGWGPNTSAIVPPINSIFFIKDVALSSFNFNLAAMGLEYLDNGGVWQALVKFDVSISDAFGIVDQIFGMRWVRPATLGWQLFAPIGRTGFWFRLAIGAGTRLNVIENPFSAQKNFARFEAEDTPGDLAVPLRMMIYPSGSAKRFLMGIYSHERCNQSFGAAGSPVIDYFTNWMPPVREADSYGNGLYQYNSYLENAAGVTTDVTNFHQRLWRLTTQVGAGPVLNIDCHDMTYRRNMFAGRFRIFAMIKQTGGVIGSYHVKIKNRAYRVDTPIWTSKTIPLKILNEWEVIDFGEIVFPISYQNFESIDDIEGYLFLGTTKDSFTIYADYYGDGGVGGNVIIDCSGICIMPVDENFVEVFWPGPGPAASADGNVIGGAVGVGRVNFVIDSVSPQKQPVRANVNDDYLIGDYPDDCGSPVYFMTPIATEKLSIPAGKVSRLYILALKYDSATGAWLHDDDSIFLVKTFRSAQYLLTRT